MKLPNPRPLLRPVSLRTFSRMRRRALSPHLWCRLEPNWRAGKSWLCLETPTVETESQLKEKFDARDNENLVDRFAKAHEHAVCIPRWKAAQAEMASLRGQQRPVFDLHVIVVIIIIIITIIILIITIIIIIIIIITITILIILIIIIFIISIIISRPGLSLWPVPPTTFTTFIVSHSFPPRPGLPLRLVSSSPLPPTVPFSLPLPSPFPHFPHFPPPSVHVLVDLLCRLVALKAVDPTSLMTHMITGPVAPCVPPFGKFGPHLHIVVCPPTIS